MTLPSTGAISLNDINNEFGLGRNLAVYRGVTWYTDAGGTGTFPNTGINMGLFRGKRSTSPSFNASISTNQLELNLRTWAVNNGWDQSSAATITIDTGVYIYSNNTSVAGLTINGSWPGGVTLVNNGYIIGRGGNGGVVNSYIAAGSAGGPAISLGVSCSIVNNSYIAGGGGGGGSVSYIGSAAGGGGAGGGTGGYNGNARSTPAAGGSPGSSGSNGTDQTSFYNGVTIVTYGTGGGGGRILPGSGGSAVTATGVYSSPEQSYVARAHGLGGGAGGSGGAGYMANYPGSYTSGAGGGSNNAGSNAPNGQGGGGGGGWGASGGQGTVNAQNYAAGGAGGRAISLNGYTATRSGTGTTYGAVS